MNTIQINSPIHSEMNKCAIALHQHASELRSALNALDEALVESSEPDWSKIHSAVASIRYNATGMSRDSQTSWALNRALSLIEGGRR